MAQSPLPRLKHYFDHFFDAE